MRNAEPPHDLLSLTIYDALKSHSQVDIYSLIVKCRESSFQKQASSGSYFLSNFPGGIGNSSIRVNRVGGAFGHASHVSTAALKEVATDTSVVNGIERNMIE